MRGELKREEKRKKEAWKIKDRKERRTGQKYKTASPKDALKGMGVEISSFFVCVCVVGEKEVERGHGRNKRTEKWRKGRK